jgi:hypothetical protein
MGYGLGLFASWGPFAIWEIVAPVIDYGHCRVNFIDGEAAYEG